MSGRFNLSVILVHIAILAVFGLMLPWMRGVDFLDPVMTSAYACLSVLFSAPAAAQAFMADRPESASEAMARICVAVIYGEIMTVIILIAAFTVVFATNRYAFPPDLLTLGEAFMLGLTASLALSAAAAWIALRFSAAVARNAVRVIFLLLLYLFYQKSHWLPDVAVQGSFISLGVAMLATFAIRRRLTPSPAISE